MTQTMPTRDSAEAEGPEGAPLALLTGGARRLGRRLALALAEQGYDLAFTFHRSETEARALVDEIRGLGRRAAAYQVDLSVSMEALALVEQVEEEIGPVDLLVSNAGHFPPSDRSSPDPDLFDRCLAVNLRAPYLLGLALGERMRARGEGCQVYLASVGGLRPYPQHVAYSLAKAGVVMLTRALALRLAPHVTVNAVAPGTLWLEGEEGGAPVPAPGTIPLGTHGEAADVEDAVLYLATAPYVTGQVLAVDGGSALASAFRSLPPLDSPPGTP